MKSKKDKTRNPWGRVAALMAFCIAVVGGIIARLDPSTIFWRALFAVIAALVMVTLLTFAAKSVPSS